MRPTVAILFVAAVYYSIMHVLGITCPISALFGVHCPACGSTRAILSLVRGDFDGYVGYNPAALFLFLAFGLALYKHVFFKGTWYKAVDTVIALSALVAFGNYLYGIIANGF